MAKENIKRKNISFDAKRAQQFTQQVLNFASNNTDQEIQAQNDIHLGMVRVQIEQANINFNFGGNAPQQRPENPYAQRINNQCQARCCSFWQNHTKLIVFLIVVIGGLSLGLSLGLKSTTDKSGQQSLQLVTQQFKCQQFSSDCIGVPSTALSYILNLGYDIDKTRSLLQISRSLNLFQNTTKNFTRDQLINVYRNITQSVVCSYYHLPNYYTSGYEGIIRNQLSNSKDLQNYFNMTQQFSGQPVKLPVSNQDLLKSCLFNSSLVRRRRLISQNHNDQENNYINRLLESTKNDSCTNNPKSALIYYSGLSNGPSVMIRDINKIKQILLTKSLGNFDQVIMMGIDRKQGKIDYYKKIITGYKTYLKQNSSAFIPTNQTLLNMYKMIVNIQRDFNNLPQNITINDFKLFYKYYVKKLIQSLTSEQLDYQIQQHKGFLLQQINNGKKVVILAHSQSTVFINKIYNTLSSNQKSSIGLVYIAPVTSNLADDSTNYITNPNDQIINAMNVYSHTNAIFSSPLVANQQIATFASQSSFNLNHQYQGYAQAYKKKIVQLIVNTKERLVQPNKTWGNGLFTITLDWDQSPDIDIHVIQPDNVHVYHASKKGNAGQLDYDVVTGYGPQHYSSKNVLKEGNYTVKLNYFKGSQPSLAKVTIDTGRDCYKKQIVVKDSLGIGGDPNPLYLIGNLKVTKRILDSGYDIDVILQ